MELQIQPELYRHKFLRRSGQQVPGVTVKYDRIIWDDFQLAAPIGSRQLALNAVPNCVMISVQHSSTVASASNRPVIYFRDGSINNPVAGSLGKGFEIQVGQILCIEADPDEFLNPLDYSIIGILGPNLVHVAFGVKLL